MCISVSLKLSLPRINNDSTGTIEIPYVPRNNGQVVNKRGRGNQRIGLVTVLPAGTGHKRLKTSPDFQVVGAYPPDQEVDIQRSAPTKDMPRKIRALATPTNDP